MAGINKGEVNIFTSVQRSSLIHRVIKKINKHLINSKIKRIYKVIKKVYKLVYDVIALIIFYLYARYVRIINRTKTVNFSIDNFDVKYGEFYFNPYSDNINLNKNAINLCIPVWGKSEQIKKAYFKPFVIGKTLIAHMQICSGQTNVDTGFLNPLKEILDEPEFNNLKNNLNEVYKNYLFFCLF